PVDAAKKNPNFSWLKKCFLIGGFSFENLLYKWACKDAKVYTNGFHIAEKLKKSNIKAKALISSTLTDSDFFFDKEKTVDIKNVKFIYLGYLRKAKGVETIIMAFKLIQQKIPN